MLTEFWAPGSVPVLMFARAAAPMGGFSNGEVISGQSTSDARTGYCDAFCS